MCLTWFMCGNFITTYLAYNVNMLWHSVTDVISSTQHCHPRLNLLATTTPTADVPGTTITVPPHTLITGGKTFTSAEVATSHLQTSTNCHVTVTGLAVEATVVDAGGGICKHVAVHTPGPAYPSPTSTLSSFHPRLWRRGSAQLKIHSPPHQGRGR